MWKILAMIFTGVLVSFYYFPFEFSFLPGINTKMGLAVVGIIVAIYNLVHKKELVLLPNILRITLLAVLLSLIGMVSVIYNSTPDYAYATYVVSMIVWLSAAYAICSFIKQVHGRLDMHLVIIYLVCVGVFQCVAALVIDSNAVIKSVVDAHIMQDQAFLNKVERIYGIGASLDTAGVRLSAVLILLVCLINKSIGKMNNYQIIASLVAYVVIAVVGNMMARTTIVGVVLSLLYAAMTFRPQNVSYAFIRFLRPALLVIAIAIPLSVYLYNHNAQFHSLSRFAFEGFFNLVETGEWEIDSNERLKTMIVFPDNAKTWIIGDGYFSNPYNTDPFYIGYQPGGYYMGTDIGYCRFLFYFGIVGLLAFSIFCVAVAKECAILLPNYKRLIFFILILGFVIWLKVATDVFLVFALLLCVGNMREEIPQIETES